MSLGTLIVLMTLASSSSLSKGISLGNNWSLPVTIGDWRILSNGGLGSNDKHET